MPIQTISTSSRSLRISRKFRFENYFCDSKWLIKLAYLVDIFTMLNNLNLSMQGIFQWIENPFTVSIEKLNFNMLLETQIIDLSCDKTYENKLKNETLVDFWCAVYNEYPELSINAIKKLLLFPTTLCEKGFSTMANIKTKQRNRLNVIHDMRISLSEIVPQWEILCKSIQNQKSH